MVKELHKAGIEVILDIVLNHTAEGSELGPILNFRGIENSVYYMLKTDRRYYSNYSGCGNTLNCNHPVVRSYILDCLRHWVVEMHVDGFRFDLASVLGRDEEGEILPNPPLLENIAEDPILRGVKLIAEAWDAGGAYQVGSFPGQRWSEWNGRFRDEVRRFWRGDPGMTSLLATRICGSSDLYQRDRKEPINSINFITCHDGFTLNDLVSYGQKHNAVNGEDSRDGENTNYSDNHGAEGETADLGIEATRLRQIKNMLATLLVSRGVPMILGGDEFRRTQRGNNNAYCQDNEISWYDWNMLNKHYEIFRFTREMIVFRKRNRVLRTQDFYTDRDISWFASSGKSPQWSHQERTLGCMIHAHRHSVGPLGQALCFLFNAETFKVRFKLPRPPSGEQWHSVVDTARPSPYDIREAGQEELLMPPDSYRVQPKSMVILIAK
jgi:glycogen operon protein